MPPKKRTRGPRVRREPSPESEPEPEPMTQDEGPTITIAEDVPEAVNEVKVEAEPSPEEEDEEVDYDEMMDLDNFENEVVVEEPVAPETEEEEEDDDDDDDDLEVIEEDDMNGPEDEERKRRRREARNRKSLDPAVKLLKIREGMTREESKLIQAAKYIKRNIVEAMRVIFQAREVTNQDFITQSHKMIAAFKRALEYEKARWNLIEVFYRDCDVRLSMMMEETSVAEHRARVFKLYAIVATELKILGYGDNFLRFLITFLKTWEKCENLAARINSSIFISYIFETGKSRLEQEGTFCGYEITDACKLFVMLRQQLYDREYTARVPSIKGMGVLQSCEVPSEWPDEVKTQSPRELLLRSCRDLSWECRLVAVQSIKPNENDVRLICDVAYFDRSNIVRCAALEQMGKLKPNKFVRDKVTLLDTCFKDHEIPIRDAAKQVLKRWVERLSDKWSDQQKGKRDNEVLELKNGTDQIVPADFRMKGYFLAGQALVLLWISDTPETPESHSNLRRMVTHTLDVIRQMYLCHAEPINNFADVIIGDLREKMLESAVPIITKSTIASLLEDSEIVRCHDAGTNRAMIFYWRCVLDYCAERKRSEADKLNALSRFISPLMTMVEHLERIILRIKAEESRPNYHGVDNFVDDVYLLQMSMVENLLSVMRHAPPEQSGQDAYKKLLISLFLNPFYQKKVMDVIAQELAPFYKDCPDDLFSLFYASVNEMRQKFNGEDFASLEGAVLIGETKLRKDWDHQRLVDPEITMREQGNRFLDYYELKMLNCLMKTDILKGWEHEYERRYGTMLRNTLESEDLDAGIMAYECLGMIGIYDISFIKDDILEWIDKEFDVKAEVHQGAIVTALTDMFIKNEEDINELFAQTPRRGFIVFLAEIIIQVPLRTESETLLRCVEAMIRIILNTTYDSTDNADWQRGIVVLMYRASFRLCNSFSSKIRSMIVVGLKFFCSLRRQNQLLIIKSFRRFFDLYTSTSNVDLFTEARSDILPKLRRCAAAFVTLTRHSLLNSDKELNMQPAQVRLMDDILHELTGSPNSSAVDFYLCALIHIEFESFPRDALIKIHKDLEDYIMVHAHDDDKGRYNELRRISKKIAAILGLNLNKDDDNDDNDYYDMPSHSTASRAKDSKRGKGRRKVSTRSAATTKFGSTDISADGIQMADDDDDDEEDDQRMSAIREESEDVDDDMEEEESDSDMPSTSAKPPPPRRAPPRVRGTPAPSAASKAKKASEKDPLELMRSPVRNPRKPPSRQNSSNRPTPAPSTRSGPSRSARRLLRSDNK